MRDRSLAVILTVVAVVLFGCPGLTVLCLGLVGLVAYYAYGGAYNTNISPGWVNGFGTVGICIGVFLVVITIIAAFFLLRRKSEAPAPLHVAPAPPRGPEMPFSPSAPAEPLPPTQPENPPEPPSSDEPLPPSI